MTARPLSRLVRAFKRRGDRIVDLLDGGARQKRQAIKKQMRLNVPAVRPHGTRVAEHYGGRDRFVV